MSNSDVCDMGLYVITNKINGQKYIGQTVHLQRRWKDHQRLAFTENHKEYDKTLYRAMRKYGIENFSFSVLEYIENKNQLGQREQYWIEYYDTYKNGYNESPGGDGGSVKGHCKHETNGRALLTEQDVRLIRTKFAEGISKRDCYLFVKDKISYYGFTQVWSGKSWSDIMPEVYTEENIKRNARLGWSVDQSNKRLLAIEEVQDIRKRKQNGESPKRVYQNYQHQLSKSSFDGVWYNKTYKDVVI